MKTSTVGIRQLEIREGRKNKAYKDTKGIWTIGVGHTGPEVKEGLVVSDAQVENYLAEDVKWAENAVNSVEVYLSQNQFDALVSFVFNVGAKAFANSTMRKKLVAGDLDGASDEFDKWHKPPEIIGRRDSERDQFRS